MAKATEMSAGDAKNESTADKPVCGVIMPISGTSPTHTKEHWVKVQNLLHRSICNAGFKATNVWLNSSTDRVSERIISNIFSFPIIVADISDLNPNVMLELGMRLASKMPTIVIVNEGGNIPFDIRDFHAIHYPGDMNMLAMEEFFLELEAALKEKHDALISGKYTPFLGHIVVDVLKPQEREVGINRLLIDRMNSIERTLAGLSVAAGRSFHIYATVPEENYNYFNESCKDLGAIKVGVIGNTGQQYYCSAEFVGTNNMFEVAAKRDDIRNKLSALGFNSEVSNSYHNIM